MNLFDVQKEVIMKILEEKKKTGEIKSQEEYETQLDYILGLLQGGEPMMKVRIQEGQTNPEDFNETYQEIAIDVMSSFTHRNEVDQANNKHQQLNQSILNNLKLNLNKVSDELERYERLINYLTTEEVALETFRDSNSFDNDLSLYTERDGAVLPPDYQVRLDMDREAIKLPTILSQNTMIGPAGVRLATIKIKKQLGGELIRLQNPENDVAKAVDTSMETFWSETILVDEPIRVKMTSEYYGIQHGAVCELMVNFDYLTQLNEISILPFTEFPLNVVAIQYYESDDANETPKEIIAPQFEEGLRSQYVTESTSYQFEDVYAKRIRVILNQEHFIKTDFFVNDRKTKQLELWYASMVEVDPDDVIVHERYNFKPLYKNKSEVSPLYSYFKENIGDVKAENVEDILGKIPESNVALSKYAYSYGLYNLGVRRNEYQDKGVYVSKPLPVAGNIKSITLDVKEQHPVIRGSQLAFTDIEYYVTHIDNPSERDWFPIVPSTTKKIKAELITPRFENGQYRTKLRFKPKSGTDVQIKKNGMNIYDWLGDVIIQDDVIIVLNFDVSATYTAEYEPTSESYMVDFLEKHKVGEQVQPNILIQEFQGTNNIGELPLRYHAFVDRTRLNQQNSSWEPSHLENDYLPVKIKLIKSSGFHIDQPFNRDEQDAVTIVNMTNYFNPERSRLHPFSEELNNYQYMVDGNTIRFNTAIPEDTRIIVEYPYLVGEVRLKAILRRNIQDYYGLTPLLHEYMIRYQRLL